MQPGNSDIHRPADILLLGVSTHRFISPSTQSKRRWMATRNLTERRWPAKVGGPLLPSPSLNAAESVLRARSFHLVMRKPPIVGTLW